MSIESSDNSDFLPITPEVEPRFIIVDVQQARERARKLIGTYPLLGPSTGDVSQLYPDGFHYLQDRIHTFGAVYLGHPTDTEQI